MRDETRRQEGQEEMDDVGRLVEGGRYLEELSGYGEMVGRVDGVMGAVVCWDARCFITRGGYLLVSKRLRRQEE
jgi:hypothetical protein